MSVGQKARAEGSGNIIVQAAGDGIHINVNLPHLTLIPPGNRAPQVRTEIDLLNPYGRAFGLVGREADMQSLWDWMHSKRPISVRTLTGRAGAGKTRAAIELVERLNQEKPGEWWAGFVQGREMRRFASQQNLADWGWARPTLIVVDYAASLVEPLREWLRDLAQNSGRAEGKRLRLLLLEREAVAGVGWLQYLCLGGHSEAGVLALFDPSEPKQLARLDTDEKRRAVLAGMLEVAAPLVHCQLPKLPLPGQNTRFDKQLENAVWEDPLYLMMAALLSLRSDLVEVLELPRTELAMRLVDHEIKRLTEGAMSPTSERLLVHLAAFAAMGNGLNHKKALEVAEEESNALKLTYPGGAGELVSRVHEVLSAPDHGLAPVVPDILAEALVIRAFSQCSKAQQEAAVLRAVKKLGRRVVPFIIRTAQDFTSGGRKEPLNWLESLIKSGQADDLGLLAAIEIAMPEQTMVLGEKALEVNELLAKRLAKLSKENANEAILREHGRLLNNLANRLSNVGRREEALEKAQQSVQISEQLAQARPDALLPELATSLNTLGIMLSDLGRHEEALEKAKKAVRISEHLAKAWLNAFKPLLVASLNNMASILRVLGRREEALGKAKEALQISEELAKVQPDAFLPDLASSLANLATMLRDLGWHEEALDKAQEGLRIYEQLAKARPDAFLPELAISLNNVSNRLSFLGRTEEALDKAQEAMRIWERLAKAQPDAFLPNLAGSLNNLANSLGVFGRREEALGKAQEAVRIYEQLTKARPEAFLPELAASLITLAGRLSGVGRREEALCKAQEALRIRRQLAGARPDAFLPDLAGSLNTLANCLNGLDRREEAVDKAQEALRLYEQLDRAKPDVFLPELAGSLHNMAFMLGELCRYEEALDKAEEALRIRERLAKARPESFMPALATSNGVRGAILQSMGRHMEASAAFAEGIRVLTPFFQKLPIAFAQLIGYLRDGYLRAIQQAQVQPDEKLLAPVVEVFDKLKQNQPKE